MPMTDRTADIICRKFEEHKISVTHYENHYGSMHSATADLINGDITDDSVSELTEQERKEAFRIYLDIQKKAVDDLEHLFYISASTSDDPSFYKNGLSVPLLDPGFFRGIRDAVRKDAEDAFARHDYSGYGADMAVWNGIEGAAGEVTFHSGRSGEALHSARSLSMNADSIHDTICMAECILEATGGHDAYADQFSGEVRARCGMLERIMDGYEKLSELLCRCGYTDPAVARIFDMGMEHEDARIDADAAVITASGRSGTVACLQERRDELSKAVDEYVQLHAAPGVFSGCAAEAHIVPDRNSSGTGREHFAIVVTGVHGVPPGILRENVSDAIDSTLGTLRHEYRPATDACAYHASVMQVRYAENVEKEHMEETAVHMRAGVARADACARQLDESLLPDESSVEFPDALTEFDF